MTTRLEGPLDPDACLLGGQTFAWRRLGRDGDGPPVYEGIVGDRLVRVRPSAEPSGGDVLVEGLPEADARRLFRADEDHAALRQRLAADPALAPLVARWPGLRVVRVDPWEALVSFILSQNSHVARITRNLQDLAAAMGDPVGSGAKGRPLHAVPSPEGIVEAGEARLRALGTGYRAPYLVAAATRVASGDLPLDDLRGADHDEARRALLEVPGVGPKVADCVLLFGLDDTSAFPVDRWVARSLSARYPDAPDRPDDWRAFARDRFGDDAGHAQQFLFHDGRMGGASADGVGGAGRPGEALR